VAFVLIGGMKLVTSPEAMAAQGAGWALTMPWLPKFIGISELAGGLGLILPAASRVKPVLTPIAAGALGVVMVLAAGYHVVNGEWNHLPGPIVFLGLCLFIAWGRWAKAPIAPR